MKTAIVKLLADWEGHEAGEVLEIEEYHLNMPKAFGLECEIVQAPAAVTEPAPESADEATTTENHTPDTED